MDVHNFKGIYFHKDTEDEKIKDPFSGAHFTYRDMYGRLFKLYKDRRNQELLDYPTT